MLKTLLLLFLIAGLSVVFRALVKNRKMLRELNSKADLQFALLEVDRLLGDSLTKDISSTTRQMVEILSKRLNASLVWIGVQKTTDNTVSVMSLAGSHKMAAVSFTVPLDADGSVRKTLDSGCVQRLSLKGDTSYKHWPIADDATFHISLSVPYRSLDGDKGVIVFFLPKSINTVPLSHTLWTRLADDFVVFLERRKNAINVSRISGFQLVIVDFLKDILEVKELSAAYNLALSMLTTRADALSAWIVAYPEKKQANTSDFLVASRGSIPEASLRMGLEKDGVSRQWFDTVMERVREKERPCVDEVRLNSALQAWKDTEPGMKNVAVIGAWPLWDDSGVHAVLFVSSTDPVYFSNNLQIFLHQLTEILHVADQQISNKAEILRRNLLYQALLDEADAVLKMNAEQPLLEEICRRLVGSTLFESAWLTRPAEDGSLDTLAFVSSVTEDANSLIEQITADLLRDMVLHVWKTGQALFPSESDSANSAELPVALLPIIRNAKLWSVLVVRCCLVEHLISADVNELLHRVASLLGRGLDEMDLKKQLADEQNRQSWLANHDALTGLNNRRGLDTYFIHAILRAQRNNTLLAILIVDLDDFKPINDTYGHEAGDRLLIKVSEALKGVTRSTDFLVRLGGDEFVVLLEGLHSGADLQPVMNHIRKAVESPILLETQSSVSVGCSAGLTLYPEDSAAPDGLLRHADEALYVAKRNKQSRPQYWVNYLDILTAEKKD
ncbi:GGDEF domain-containing protein [Acidithiobacillus sulfurivorans]|uniref:GGDEF domain-containing protein n=1 Tax=Acidithiobacillus sulfurivorans TaxID=1958756 RepID=A0ABS5ZVP0_9PROT|nr:GGDEF domain-containing protein [Acidithiobacillus sulfurivorans]MBU2759148.1 GGDEF domain-containing protein [Acidithiobacillus sulfurivorans]